MPDLSRITLPNNTTVDIKDAHKSGVYTVIGTQTTSTNIWTGELHGVSALYDGLTINYYLPYSSSGSPYLNLTLDDGTTTGNIAVYIQTNYINDSAIPAFTSNLFTYYSAGSITQSGTVTTNDMWLSVTGANIVTQAPLLNTVNLDFPVLTGTYSPSYVRGGTGKDFTNFTYNPSTQDLSVPTVNGYAPSGVWKGTQAEYDLITTPDPNTTYYITDGDAPFITNASVVSYDNTDSGLSATNVQDAIDEVDTTVTTHTHGDITHDGKLTNEVLTVANGDKLVVTDNDNDSKLQRTSIYFDASTANKALSQKGTWEAIDRVNQTTVSDNADRPILLGATGTADVNSNVGKVSTLTYNPSTGNLKATKLNSKAVSDITDHQQLYSYRLTNVGSNITIRMSVPTSVEFLIHIVGAVSNGGAFYDSILTGTSVSSGTATIYVRNNGSANLGSVIITNSRIKFTVTGYTQLLITSLHKITNIEATVS